MLKSILILAKYPDSMCLRDGYFQRILSIDKELNEFNRYYIDYSYKKIIPSIVKIKDGVFIICTQKYNPIGILRIVRVIYKLDAVYIHSVFSLGNILHIIYYFMAKNRIFDMHGVVPEEFKMQGRMFAYQISNRVESFAARRANTIIGVTKRMIDHISKKYSLTERINFIILPIIPPTKSLSINIQQKKLNSIIYCGGLQTWQQTNMMLRYLHDNCINNEFIFLVPQPAELTYKYTTIYGADFPCIACSVDSGKIEEWYAKYSFGLVFREDVLVNNVACPTKLIEYFQNDIVPIVDTSNIGDFMDMGYSFVRYNQKLPPKDVWRQKIVQNREVFKKICAINEKGLIKLKMSI